MSPLSKEAKTKRSRARFKLAEPAADQTDRVILEEIAPESRVIDLGCGDGRLLRRLRDEKSCAVCGVELDHAGMQAAVATGLPVLALDLDRELLEIPDSSFDYAVLSQTLPEIRQPKALLSEMLRIAERVVIVVPNFGHWRVRAEILFRGRAPVTQSLPYNWFDSPNTRFMSLHDFRDLLSILDCRILREVPLIRGTARDRAYFANLRADNVMYLLERNAAPGENSDA